MREVLKYLWREREAWGEGSWGEKAGNVRFSSPFPPRLGIKRLAGTGRWLAGLGGGRGQPFQTSLTPFFVALVCPAPPSFIFYFSYSFSSFYLFCSYYFYLGFCFGLFYCFVFIFYFLLVPGIFVFLIFNLYFFHFFLHFSLSYQERCSFCHVYVFIYPFYASVMFISLDFHYFSSFTHFPIQNQKKLSYFSL